MKDYIIPKGQELPVFKTLTDEEITEIYNQIISVERNSWHEFARAILRKAQEK